MSVESLEERPPRRIAHVAGTPAISEAILCAVAAIIGFLLLSRFDAVEHYIAWAEAHEEYELDELLILGFSTTIMIAIYSVRRLADLRRQEALRESSDARARYLAFHDPLTGLANRAHFTDRLTALLSREQSAPAAVLALDMDRFKEINDSLGHAAGDTALRVMTERFQDLIRATDFAGRLGGDEFALVQAGPGNADSAAHLASRLLEALAEPYQFEGHEMRCSVSIGIALAPNDGTTADELLRAADVALYEAKKDGRGIYRFFEPEMNRAQRERRRLEEDLRRALDEGRFALLYQPLHDLRSGELTGFEALLRLNHPTRGQMQPRDFIPLAEDCGLIVPIGEWVMHAACREAKSWANDRKVAVNLSPIQFSQGDVAALVQDALEKSGLPASRLEVEVTESLLMADTEKVMTDLARIRALGVSIALDDFGSGYSSLSYLWRFPFDKLKIDRSFVTDVHTDAKVEAIVRTIIKLGETLDLVITAEGIETIEQATLLSREGCQFGQGFFYGRPQMMQIDEGAGI